MELSPHLSCYACMRSTLFACFECKVKLCREHATAVRYLDGSNGHAFIWMCPTCLPRGGDDER
jgi:hypothetical protein